MACFPWLRSVLTVLRQVRHHPPSWEGARALQTLPLSAAHETGELSLRPLHNRHPHPPSPVPQWRRRHQRRTRHLIQPRWLIHGRDY
jgi:hypothetical protein